ncbi:type II secretion system F family protein [Paenisporosarcina quisquiliarum]|uniref:Type II secretion system F family protein n=1 Tax=Paenisporosarcina quisquiliarum TaxID=365346 RepID=A0A9X3RDN2_9BACL|nr:type II secretion system F family protein [Paenisporosarcina quisquiliarum]MCZ8537269.1 type II secretion system F family protein [Paenisporosarcina quisquiliarum]
MTPLLLIGSFLLTTALFKMVVTDIANKGNYEKRLKKYVVYEEKVQEKKDLPGKNSRLKKVSNGIEKLINLTKHQQLLIQSGVKLSLGELFLSRVMFTVICMSVGQVYNMHLILILLLGIIGFQVPILYVKKKRTKRLQFASAQLGEALGTMANALRAGFSFMQAMDLVANEIGEPLGPEFLKALQEINFGLPVDVAFMNLIERLPDKELEIVLNTLIIQRSTGGNLAYLFETMQETIFDRSRIRNEVKTLTAQGKLSAIIITILPIALAIYIKLVNPKYIQLLFSHPLGWVMVIYGFISLVVGWVVINKIVHFEV